MAVCGTGSSPLQVVTFDSGHLLARNGIVCIQVFCYPFYQGSRSHGLNAILFPTSSRAHQDKIVISGLYLAWAG
jgi:hypothetical protein